MSAALVGYSKGAKPPFSARRGLRKSMQESIVQPHSMVTPCPDRFRTRREPFLIGLLEALPVCPMALLVFIDSLSGPPGALRSARSRLRRGSARQMGSRHVYWTSCNLQGCILSRRRMFRPPISKACRLPSRCGAAALAAGKPSRTRTEDGSLLRVPQEVPAAHMTASFRPSGSHAIRTVSRVALGASRGRPRAQ